MALLSREEQLKIIAFKCKQKGILGPMTREETAKIIAHKMHFRGCSPEEINATIAKLQ